MSAQGLMNSASTFLFSLFVSLTLVGVFLKLILAHIKEKVLQTLLICQPYPCIHLFLTQVRLQTF